MNNRQRQMATVQAKPQPILVDLAKTAVLVVDMQNAFVNKGGYFNLVGLDIAPIQKIIEPCREIINLARTKGIRLIYLQMGMQSGFLRQGATRFTEFNQIWSLAIDEAASRMERQVLPLWNLGGGDH